MELPELKPADLFQLAFLVTRETVRLIGPRALEEIMTKQKLTKLFSVDEAGKLNIKFSLDDPQIRVYYQSLLTRIEAILEKTFGENFTKNLFEQNINKLKSWMP